MVDKEALINELCSHYDKLGDYIVNIGVDRSDADDILNDVYLAAFDNINNDNGPEDGKMLSWLKGIAANKRNEYFRKKYRRKELSRKAENELSEMNCPENIKDDESVESVLLKAEERDLVYKLLDTLPEASRKIVVMHAWGESTFAEIADIMDANINTVKSLYYRSRELMKRNYYKMTGEEEYYD